MEEKSFPSRIFNWRWCHFIFIFRGNSLLAIECPVICPLDIIVLHPQIPWRRQSRRLESIFHWEWSRAILLFTVISFWILHFTFTHGCTSDGVMANCVISSSDSISWWDSTISRLLRRQVTSAEPAENCSLGIHDWTLVKVSNDVKVKVIVFTFLLNKLLGLAKLMTTRGSFCGFFLGWNRGRIRLKPLILGW